MSSLSYEDEWTEINKYNAMLDKYEKRNKIITVKKNQKRLQDALKEQIIEQRKLKLQQLEQDK